MTVDATTSVLVVANETLVGAELVAPVTQPREGYVVYRDSRRAAAGRRLDRALAALRLAGIPAHGGVFDADPLAVVNDVLASDEIDEIVVCTHPETTSGWLRRDLVGRLRSQTGLPVQHAVVEEPVGAHV